MPTYAIHSPISVSIGFLGDPMYEFSKIYNWIQQVKTYLPYILV
jgi:hypothetical protein